MACSSRAQAPPSGQPRRYNYLRVVTTSNNNITFRAEAWRVD